MTRLEEVKAFARDYINGNRTRERDAAIRQVYQQLTGSTLRTSCGTCMIEGLFKILKIMNKPASKYQLKKGAVLQPFGNADMFATWETLTDEIAEWHLRHTRGAASLFAKLPEDYPAYEDPTAIRVEVVAKVVAPPKMPAKPRPSRSKKAKR